MAADSVTVFYGLRYALGRDGEMPEGLLTALERREDARIVAARRQGLKTYLGRVTAGGEVFLLIGAAIGTFGAEGEESKSVADDQMSELVRKTREKLRAAGFEEPPALHVQFEAQY